MPPLPPPGAPRAFAVGRVGLFALVLVLALALLGGAACKPDLGAPLSLVASPRLLAVRGMPPEAAPGAPVSYDVLAVDAGGTLAAPALTWALCHVPKPPAEANAVSTACLAVPDEAGPSATFMAPMPGDACMLYGPITPPAVGNAPPVRPRDPDITGGFYQPLRVTLSAGGGGERGFLLERIRCNLANAPADVTGVFTVTYRENQNPTLARITLDPDGQATALYAAGSGAAPPPATVATGQIVTLEGAWPDDTPESYPVWNVGARLLETRREALRLSWFATAGALEHETTGRDEDEADTTARNVWTAPSEAGLVHLWAVLRDSRGGVDFAAFDLLVAP